MYTILLLASSTHLRFCFQLVPQTDPQIKPEFYDTFKTKSIKGIGKLLTQWLEKEVRHKIKEYRDLLSIYEDELQKARNAGKKSEIASIASKIHYHCINSINQLVKIEQYELGGYFLLWDAYVSRHRRVGTFVY